jgi:peptide-methionine (S)-S-oxide reductase
MIAGRGCHRNSHLWRCVLAAARSPNARRNLHLVVSECMRLITSAPSLLGFVRFLLPTAALAASSPFPSAHFMSKTSLVSASDALPGRSSAIASGETHFVLKNPLHAPLQATQEEALFGCGCFWGAEKGFWRLPGVFTTAVGYAGGFTKNPTYEEVCSGRTAHTEVVRVVWDRRHVSFSDLLKLFWECHNPTQGMAQGNDQGTQYRSAIFVNSVAMLNVAEASKRRYQELLAASGKSAAITTEIKLNETFYFAEEYHQQ